MTKHHATAGWALENIVIMKHLNKKEVLFVGNRLLQTDLTIMEDNRGNHYKTDRYY